MIKITEIRPRHGGLIGIVYSALMASITFKVIQNETIREDGTQLVMVRKSYGETSFWALIR